MILRIKVLVIAALTTALSILSAFAQATINLRHIASYQTGIYDEAAAEIAAFDPNSNRLYFIHAANASVFVLDISDPSSPEMVEEIDLSQYGTGVNSVAVNTSGLVAVALESDPRTSPGKVAFLNPDGEAIRTVDVGVQPDMVCFTPNGRMALTADEGEPNDAYDVDPAGSISIIDLSNGVENAYVTIAGFERFDGSEDSLRRAGIRIFGPNASASQDLEPEYITIDPDSRMAWVSLQEANAIAEIDLEDKAITRIMPLGFKDHSIEGNGLDASDRDDSTNIALWPAMGMFLPDAIALTQNEDQKYLLTANEGDTRDYDGFSEEARVSSLTLDSSRFPNAGEIQSASAMGRLKTTLSMGDTDGDEDTDVIYTFGARSFSIFDMDGRLVFDSGDQFERITADLLGANFNSSNDENGSGDSRSDDKGPEPEGITVAEIQGRKFAFICLERVGGVMAYDVSDPETPTFAGYVNVRNFEVDFDPDNVTEEQLAAVGDLGPESLVFIRAENSPINRDMLIVPNEVSGSISFFEVNAELGVKDFEASPLPVQFAVTAVSPNPFNGAARITVNLPESGLVRLVLYNLKGEKVADLANGRFARGSHNFAVEANHLASGTYLAIASLSNGPNSIKTTSRRLQLIK